jgi:hypothetical protein
VQTQESISFEGLRMSEERAVIRGPELGRWLVVAIVIAAGIGLYFWYAPRVQPAATTTVHEAP